MSAPGATADRPRPGVGVGLFLRDRTGRILLMRRVGAHGVGTYGLVGGKLEHGDGVEATAVRECREETGVELDEADVRVLQGFTNDVFVAEGVHYVTLYAEAELPDGAVPRIMEPGRCTHIGWYREDDLPTPLFLPLANLMAQGPPRFGRGPGPARGAAGPEVRQAGEPR